MSASKHPKDNSFKFRYGDYFSEFEDVLDQFEQAEIDLYRWTHNPIATDDGEPQIFQNNNPTGPEQLEKPDPDAPLEVKLNYIENFGLSHFISYEIACTRFKAIYNRILKRRGAEEAESFVKQKGRWVVKMHYTPETARLGEVDKSGHINVYISDSARFEDCIDKSMNPQNMLDNDNEA